MSEYRKKLIDAIHEKTLGMNSSAVINYCKIIEEALEQFYKEVWGHLTPDEKQKLLSVERQFGKKNPADTLGLGRWVNFYEKSDMPNILFKTHDIDPAIFDFRALADIAEIRNKCMHEGYQATSAESENVATFTEKLLLSARLVDEIPKPYLPSETEQREESHQRLVELANKIRMILSTAPTVRYEDNIVADQGKSYWVKATWEFVGLHLEDRTIHILVLEKDSTIHEDVIDDAYERLFDKMWEPVRPAMQDLQGFKIEVNVSIDRASSWGDALYEIEF